MIRDDTVEHCRTLADVLDARAAHSPQALAFRFLASSGEEEGTLDYASLRTRARVMAAHLARSAAAGDRVAVLLPPGLDYVTSLMACQYAGAIAVPAYPPSVRRADPRIAGIIADCGATAAIVTADLRARLDRSTFPAMTWLDVESLGVGDEIDAPRPRTEADIAFLQYTSGSTGDPRGVILVNRNVLHNLLVIRGALRPDPAESHLFWVPPYHDMGLVGGILNPLYAGATSTLMSPSTFSQRPFRWLQAMSRWKAGISAAPNFAYDLCVDRVSDEERDTLDLSSWRIANNGAEPVRAATIDRFVARFSGSGFRRSTFFPCYGLAESTLFVSGGSLREDGTSVLMVDRPALAGGQLSITNSVDDAQLVSNGPVGGDLSIRIVNPVSLAPALPGEIGEVWVAGGSIAPGYWNRPQESAETFHASIDGDARAFLRTGDLGILRDAELYITGRAKDVVIIEGRNIYPQDIEHAAEGAHELVRLNGVAAFAAGPLGRQRVIVVAEVARAFRESRRADVISAIREEVATACGIRLDDVVIIRQGTLPKTTSGKVRRRHTRAMYEAGTMELAGEGTVPPSPGRPAADASALPFLERWLTDEMQLPAGFVDGETSLRELGLDSLAATRLLVALERHIGRRIDASILWRSATLGEFAQTLGAEHLESPTDSHTSVSGEAPTTPPVAFWPEFRALEHRLQSFERSDAASPFFMIHDGVSGATTHIEGREVLNFANYNYLGLNGHPDVTKAAQDATARYGTSVSASRIVSGERALHTDLEDSLARFMGSESAVVFVGGHATNVSVLSHLFGPGDLIVCDSLMHNSALQGAAFSGARWMTFAHNNWEDCDAMLRDQRRHHRRAIIVIEGAYSADGDVPDLDRFLELKARHGAMLMVDEAHSLGVLGETGRGITEAFGVDAKRVDILMGTLSKTLASCGGYIAGSRELTRYLRFTAPGFVYSVGISPPNAASALEALRVLERSPERVKQVQANAAHFASCARAAGLDVGSSAGTAVVPVIVGDSNRAVRLSQVLLQRGINVQPMISPAVPNDGARLRFFISSDHTRAQIEAAVQVTAAVLAGKDSAESARGGVPVREQLSPAN